MSSSSKLWQPLHDSLEFHCDTVRQVAASPEAKGLRRRCANIQVSTQALRFALEDCLGGGRDYSPALVYERTRQRLSTADFQAHVGELITACPTFRQPLHISDITKQARIMLQTLLPLKDDRTPRSDQELPERENIVYKLVSELIDEVFHEVHYAGAGAKETAKLIIQELPNKGARRVQSLIEQLDGDRLFCLSEDAIVAAAILHVSRMSGAWHGSVTADRPLRPSSAVPAPRLEA